MTELNENQNIPRSGLWDTFLPRSGKIELPDFKTHLIFWSIAIIGWTLDLWSKAAVFAWLQKQNTDCVRILDGVLQFVMAQNPGAAFGIAQGRTYLFIAVSVIAILVILTFFMCSGAERRIMHVAMALFVAGVCGNLFDRIFNNGLVRDFIDVTYLPGKHWPAFNVADSMLCVAVGLILMSSFLTEKPSQKCDQPRK